MNKIKTAFSLIEAMIILVLISIAILAMVPLISQRTTSSFWREIRPANNVTIFQYGTELIERLGFGHNDTNTLNSAKMSVTNANIGYSSANSSIRLGRDYSDGNYTQTNTPANKIILGQNACTGAGNSINIGSFDNNKADATNCNSNANILQIGDFNATSISATTPLQTLIKINNQNIIDINGDNFDFNLPTNGASPTDLFNYDSATTTLTFSHDVTGIGDLTIENWTDNTTIANETDNICGSPTNNFIKYKTTDATPTENTAGFWFFCGSGQGYNATDISYTCPSSCGSSGGGAETSDRRLKNIISDYTKGFDYVSKIQTYLFKFKNDKSGRIHAGLIAQKIIGIFDEALHKDEKEYYSYEKEPILYSMVNSVKEISNKQDEILKEQKALNKKADKLLKAYR